MPKRKTVADFLSSSQDAPGAKCATCNHRKRTAIEEDCATFNEARRTGETTHSWRNFVQHHLKPTLGFSHQWAALRRHLENCLGQEIH